MSTVKGRTRLALGSALAALAALLVAGAASAAASPVWEIDAAANTTAKEGGQIRYIAQIENIGDEQTTGPYTVEASLPPGLTGVEALTLQGDGWSCSPPGQTMSCTNDGSNHYLIPGDGNLRFRSAPFFIASVDPGTTGTPTATFSVSGGGASNIATTVDPTLISPTLPGFGIESFDGLIGKAGGSPYTQAGGHPYDLTTDLSFNTITNTRLIPIPPMGNDLTPVEDVKDATTYLPAGLVGDPTALGECELGELANSNALEVASLCPLDSQIGVVTVKVNTASGLAFSKLVPLFNMVPPPGAAARFGFNFAGNMVVLDARLRTDGSYGLAVDLRNSPQGLDVFGARVTFWGVPGDGSHDRVRACPGFRQPTLVGGAVCHGNGSQAPFLRMPTTCTKAGQGLEWGFSMDSWQHPGAFDEHDEPLAGDSRWQSASYESHESPGAPFLPADWGEKEGTTGCDEVPVKGNLSAEPTALDTETSSGLSVHAEVPNPGLENAKGIASSDIEGVKVALPQGVTINPSQAEGLGVCSSAQYESSELSFNPDGRHGCPSDSKVGTVEVHTPLLAETIPGNVYVAKPYDNPFDSLLAIYVVLEEPQRGILVKLPGEIKLNQATGRIETEFTDLPQVPFESFDFHFRQGARAPLVTPPTCGTYTTEAVFTPWSDPSHTIVSNSQFQIVHGIGGGPCPPGGVPSFKPHFQAGSVNNNAGSYSPFDMRITRNDGEQDMTRFSAVLPPGVLGKLAGVDKCPEAAIAIAKAKTGLKEIASPSCPANSQIGRSIVGAGVGSVLTYVPGKVYLGGPFHGDPLSVIAITPAVAGPFDVGTVVVHEALTLNPVTAEVEVDGAASDPIPHILQGIPAKLRDLRVYVDRSDFTLNPTSCDPSSTRATLFGGAGDAFSSADDVPVGLLDRYQAASCASLGFEPKLDLKLRGGTKRGGHPALTATYTPRRGDANVKGLVVRLPRSAFLDQGHIRTICTRVQFAADACPKAAQYGSIKAWTPLLEEPLSGPVWLRSSNHKLPDLVFDLHGLVDVEVATRIDSIKGGIRARVESTPDAPLTKVVLRMQGAKKGLIVNSRNLCGGTNRANVELSGQNGKLDDFDPVLKPDCGGRSRGKSGGGHAQR